GLLTTDTAVWPLLGSDDPRYARVTVHDLLTMSSPLDCDDHHRRSPGHEERMYRAPVWREFALTLPFDATFGRGPSGQGRFAYCTAGVFLLGQVVEAVTGEPFDAYAQRRLFDPLDIHDVVWRRSPAGEVQTGGQLGIGPTDLAKLGRLVLDGGEWQGQRLLSEAWIQAMLTPYHGSGPEHAYGYLWWFRTFDTEEGPQPSAVMSGNGGNLVALFRERDAVVVVQSAAYNRPWADERSAALVEAALAALPE
ncbi:MAG: CubicO group peptidase (beta-lactamase class C family), partial [Myxococcota bacterium]